jgi:thiamine-phosphate pyrophosphorylase
MTFQFPKLYPILDASFIPSADRAAFLHRLGSELARSGVTLLEYRNKTGFEQELLADGKVLRQSMAAENVKLILNDRVDLVDHLGFDGAHVDAGDITPAQARTLLGPNRIIGTVGGSEALVDGVLDMPADYFSIGPVFETRTKQTTKPPIGLAGVKRLRTAAGPGPVLVAVGGVSLASAAQVLEAGASIVAVSAGLFAHPDPAAEFRRWIKEIA